MARLAAEAGEPLLAYSAQNLAEFLRYLDWACGLVRTPEQLARVAYACAAREAASGVRYADVIVNPTHWPSWRTRLDCSTIPPRSRPSRLPRA